MSRERAYQIRELLIPSTRRAGGKSRLGLGRRQRPSFRDGLEAAAAVAAVAEGFVFRLAAAAETDHRAAGQIKRPPGVVDDGELAFDPERPVVAYCDPRVGHLIEV